MGDLGHFLEQYGAIVLVVAVLAQQVGVPIPAIPVVLGAGALAGAGKMSLWGALALSVVASLPGDLLWYYLGVRRGRRVLATLCRISLEPDSCVRRTETFFARHGPRSLVVARFIPGLSTVATPLAGVFGIGLPRFLAYDVAGAALWAAVYLLLGYALSGQLERIAGGVSAFGGLVAGLAIGAIATYLVVKFVQRYRVIRMLRIQRIEVDELARMIQAGDDVAIVDLRSAADAEAEPFGIPGAVRVDLAELATAHGAIPRDREIILYCT